MAHVSEKIILIAKLICEQYRKLFYRLEVVSFKTSKWNKSRAMRRFFGIYILVFLMQRLHKYLPIFGRYSPKVAYFERWTYTREYSFEFLQIRNLYIRY